MSLEEYKGGRREPQAQYEAIIINVANFLSIYSFSQVYDTTAIHIVSILQRKNFTKDLARLNSLLKLVQLNCGTEFNGADFRDWLLNNFRKDRGHILQWGKK